MYQKLVKGDESVVSIEGGVDERRGPSALYIFALPKPGEEVNKIREQIFDEIKRIASDGPTAAEMEKLRNSLCNDAVRGRQSTMYRAQRLAEFALYDSESATRRFRVGPLSQRHAPKISRHAVARYMNVKNRVVLDIIPAPAAEHAAKRQRGCFATAAGRSTSAGCASAAGSGRSLRPNRSRRCMPKFRTKTVASEQPKDPADVPPQTKPGSGPLHP